MRSVSDGFKSVVEDQVVRPFFAIELLFDSNSFRVWSGLGELQANGVIWQGAASLISLTPIEETSEIAATGMTFTMSGLPSSLVSLALQEPYQGRVAKVYFGLASVPVALLTEGGDRIVAEDLLPLDISSGEQSELIEMFSGHMDVMTITDSGNEAVISVTAESRLIALERPNEIRYTPEDQKRKYPDDRGLDFVADLQDKEIKWGGG